MVFSTSSGPDRGFSIVELLVGLAVIAILAALAVPSVGSWIDQYRVKKAGRQIVTDMQLAKMKCISERLQYRVTLDSMTSSYAIERGNASSGSTTWTQFALRSLANPASPYYAKGVAVSSANIVFSPSGSATFATITVTGAGGYTKSIKTSIVGRIRLD